MSKKLPAAKVTATRKFKEMLPVLLSQVATHGVAHLKILRVYEGDDQPVQVILIDTTSDHLPKRGHKVTEKDIDYRMLREVQRG